MPYKDLEQKRAWEQEHRAERLARRRELRQIQAARTAAEPAPSPSPGGSTLVLLPILAGGALAAYNPKLAVGAGGLTLVIAAYYKKGRNWWIAGILILVIGLLFHLNDEEGSL
jgi:hypothetical protein